MFASRALQEIAGLVAEGAGADLVPDEDEDNGDEKDEGGDGVDFGGHADAEAAPDFLGESIVAADEEDGDGDFVHGKSEDEQARGDERELEIRNGDAPEGLPGSGAEVERGFFLGAIHFLKAGKEFGGGDGDECRAMAEKDGEEAEVKIGGDCEH